MERPRGILEVEKMDKAMYLRLLDRVVGCMVHLLSTAVLLMFLWLMIPLGICVAAAVTVDALKHVVCYACLGRVSKESIAADVLGVVLGASMIVALT